MAARKRARRTERPANLVALGNAMQRRRNALKIGQAQIANLTNVDVTLVSKIENGRRKCDRNFIEAVDEFLKADGELIELWEDLSKDGVQVPDWFDWEEIEGEAKILTFYILSVFSGLAQTRAYASVLLAQNQKALEKRMERQGVIGREDPPAPIIVFLVDEQALRRPVGGKEIMAEQLRHMIELSELPNVKVQVVESDGDHDGNGGSFIIATLPDDKEVAYYETPMRGFTTDNPDHLAALRRTLVDIRSKAFPEKMSIEIIRKAIEDQWT